MKRREFMLLLGGTAVIFQRGAEAQPAAKPRIGYVWIGARGTDVTSAGLRRGLADLGYEAGRNIAFEERYADGDSARVPALISELLAQKLDVLITVGTFATLAARRATSTVPIVFASGDPVKAGIVASLNRPGGNATGLSILSSDYSAKWWDIDERRAAKADSRRCAFKSENPAIAAEVDQMKTTAQALGVDLSVFIGNATKIDESLASIANGNIRWARHDHRSYPGGTDLEGHLLRSRAAVARNLFV